MRKIAQARPSYDIPVIQIVFLRSVSELFACRKKLIDEKLVRNHIDRRLTAGETRDSAVAEVQAALRPMTLAFLQALLGETRAAEHSAFTERAIFGQLTTGVYSNADLVANFEGYRFYRSLFEDGVIPGKPAILAWRDDHWEIQRPFTWADHVNEYWDEALNINHFDSLLYPYMEERLADFCPMYRQAPEMFYIEDEDSLKERYAHLQLRDTSELRLDNLCTPAGSEGLVSGTAAALD